MADDAANVDIIKCVALFYKLGAAPKDFIRKKKIHIKLPRSLYFYLDFCNSLQTSRAIFVVVKIRGTFHHFIFRLISLLHKTEYPSFI